MGRRIGPAKIKQYSLEIKLKTLQPGHDPEGMSVIAN